MISTNAFITDTLNTVDLVINSFVNKAYIGLIMSNYLVINAVFTAYVVFIGYRLLMHSSKENVQTIVVRLISMLCIYGLIMSWGLYNTFIYNIFTNEPALIAQTLVNSAGQLGPGQNVTQSMDGIFQAVMNVSAGFFAHGGFSTAGVLFILYGVLTFVIGFLFCVFALVLYIFAKMMLAIGLALGPLFLLFALFDPTRGWFESWLQKLFTMALIPVVTSTILALMLSVINTTLPRFNVPTDQQTFNGVAPFLGLSLASFALLLEVKTICSSLGGGLTLGAIAKSGALAKQAATVTGAAALGKSIGSFVKSGASGAASSMGEKRAASRQRMAEEAQNKKVEDFFRG